MENRLIAIRKFVDRCNWNFVKGRDFPADGPTSMVSNFNGIFFLDVGLLDLLCYLKS